MTDDRVAVRATMTPARVFGHRVADGAEVSSSASCGI
jgi:hypothetical protein